MAIGTLLLAFALSSTVTFELPEGERVVATQTDLTLHGPGRFTWFGELNGRPRSHVALAVYDGRAVGHLGWDDQHYRIRSTESGSLELTRVDPGTLPQESEPIEVDVPSLLDAPPLLDEFLLTDSGEQIDVIIVYTASAAAFMLSYLGDIDAFVQLLIDETNQAYANSGIIQRVNLVHHAQTNYAETGNSFVDLPRLQNPADGFMDDVHQLRETYCADVVSLLTQNFDTCGLGYQMTDVSPAFEIAAFSTVRVGCAVGFYSYGHEMGHNMGCNHDRLSTANPGAYAYSHGYVNVTDSWRTIMAIFSGTQRLQYWSNPDVIYDGDPMGVPGSGASSADCSRTLNNTRTTVANFRDSSQCVLRVPETSLHVDRAGTDVAVSWGTACGVADEYTIYEGQLDAIGSGYTHQSRVCSDSSGDLSETFAPSPANTYYLVVPRNSNGLEGSYGGSRPQGADAAGCGITGQRPGGVCS